MAGSAPRRPRPDHAGASRRELIDQVIADVGGAFVSGLGYIGDRLGLFHALVEYGPISSQALSGKLSLDERYLREWLDAMVSAGYVEVDPESGYWMTPEQESVLADEKSPTFAAGAFQFAIPSLAVTETLIERFRSGGGIRFSDLGPEIPEAIDRMHRPWFDHQLTTRWLPALPDVVGKLERGIRVLDVGCGIGRAALAIGREFPNSRVLGVDPHGPSIASARKLAEEAGVENVKFRDIELAEMDANQRFDLILAIDCIHDMIDPIAELIRIRQMLAPDGVLFWSEPSGSADPTKNRNLAGRMRSALSPYHCLTVSLAEGGAGLGTIIGEEGARQLAKKAGYMKFERVPIESTMQQFFLAS